MRLLVLAAVVFSLLACGPHTTPPRDVRVTPPATDSTWYAIQTPEQIIPAKSERMFCTDLVYRGDSTPFRDVDAYQGKFAHHLILMETAKPKPEGTTYDCTDISSMKDMRPFAIPIDLPAGYAAYLQTGKNLVVQMHYVNTSTDDILVQDFIRLKKVAATDVSHWAAPIATNTVDFTIPPRAADTTVTFDCQLDKEFDLLLLGGHMHEHGASIKTEIGPDVNHLVVRNETAAWKPEYRDSPPVTLFTNAPMHLPVGTVIRTTCSWKNDSDRELKFPEEMCTSFGMIGETKDPWVCGIGTPL